ncbi:MAG TPA: hypothetical protein VGL38_07505 [bacterium]|jgi:hypothetical protein
MIKHLFRFRFATLFCISLLLTGALVSCSNVSKKLQPGYTSAQLDSFLVISVHTKFLQRVDLDIEEARVNPEIWAKLPDNAKHSSARMLAWYCAQKGDRANATPNVTIVNEENGETLARYNEMLGYSSE